MQSSEIGAATLDRQSVIVIGAGVVGLTIAYHLRQEGAEVTMIDRNPQGDKASFGSEGGIAVSNG